MPLRRKTEMRHARQIMHSSATAAHAHANDRSVCIALRPHAFVAMDDARSRGSGLLEKLGAQHASLHLLGVALDLGGVVGEGDVLDHRAALERDGRALHLQVLDEVKVSPSARILPLASRVSIGCFPEGRGAHTTGETLRIARARSSTSSTMCSTIASFETL